MACVYPVALHLEEPSFDPFDLVCSNAESLRIAFLVRIRTEWVPSYN